LPERAIFPKMRRARAGPRDPGRARPDGAGLRGSAVTSFFATFRKVRLTQDRKMLRFHRSTVVVRDRAHGGGRQTEVVPWGLVGMIGLVAIFECFVSRHWVDFSDPVSLSWRSSAILAATEAPHCDVLCMGDSLVKHGLVPSVMEQATGRRTANLSAARAPLLWTYALLRRALDAGARPAAIIINAKPAVLIGGPEYDMRYWQEVLTVREGLELFQMTRKGPLLAATLLGRLLPSLRSRLEVQSNVMAALRGETDRLYTINRVLLRNWTVNRGANIVAAGSPFQGAVAPEVAGRLHVDRFHVDKTNAIAVKRLLNLAAERNISVYWLLAPLSPNLQALRDQSGSEGRYEEFVKSFQARYPRNLTVLDARRADYPAALFADATHLNGAGAVALSRSVAAAIAPRLSRRSSSTVGAWIALEPPHVSAEYERPLEDLDTSRRILEREAIPRVSSR
jgi:lysophospholipase L1-like esterase